MAKALLIVDVEDKHLNGNYYADVFIKEKPFKNTSCIAKTVVNCVEIRPIPECFKERVLADTYEDGWNDCLETILGDTE